MVEKKTGIYDRRAAYGLCCLVFTIWIAFLLCCAQVCAESAVYDEAGLFDTGESRSLEELAAELAEKYEQNIILLTADDAYGLSSAELAERLYETRGYEENGERGGIVLLIDLDNRELNLVTSGEMIRYITDAREEAIYDAGYEYAGEEEYADAMYAMLQEVGECLEKGIPRDQYSYDTQTGRISRYHSLSMLDWLLALGGALLVSGISCLGLVRSYHDVHEYEYAIGQNADIKVTGKRDRLVNQFVTQRRIPRNPPPEQHGGGMGGPSSGRSSTHTSSGGNTFGGGHGRKF